jgi:hypothetical protein
VGWQEMSKEKMRRFLTAKIAQRASINALHMDG